MTKNFVIIFLMVLFAISADGFACSMAVNANYQKNQLVAQGASHLGLSLENVSSVGVSEYAKLFSGAETASSCPTYLETTAKVTLKYSPQAKKTCTSSVLVKIKKYIGDETPEGPMEKVTYSGQSLKCLILIQI
jgi:hypothetical protein